MKLKREKEGQLKLKQKQLGLSLRVELAGMESLKRILLLKVFAAQGKPKPHQCPKRGSVGEVGVVSLCVPQLTLVTLGCRIYLNPV